MTRFRRGDVVLVRYPHSDLVTYKKRPVLVVQDEDVETGLRQRLVVAITSNLARSGETRVFVPKDSAEGKQMGLLTDSMIMADSSAAMIPREADKIIGSCSVMDKVDRALRTILRP